MGQEAPQVLADPADLPLLLADPRLQGRDELFGGRVRGHREGHRRVDRAHVQQA
ncbi:hypothetical protein ACU4GG_39820 [Streptomyces nojiriensis]